MKRERVFYHFQQDARLKEAVPGSVSEAYVLEDELEACETPSDEYWQYVNKMIEGGT